MSDCNSLRKLPLLLIKHLICIEFFLFFIFYFFLSYKFVGRSWDVPKFHLVDWGPVCSPLKGGDSGIQKLIILNKTLLGYVDLR